MAQQDGGGSSLRAAVDASLGPLLVALVFGVYLRTLFPGAPGGDSGELLTESCHLGVAHPPGYPLFVMLGHLAMQWLPWGSPAYRVNVLSAAFDVGAVFFIFKSAQALLRPRKLASWIAFAVAALYAFSPLIWLYAIGAEVFSLNNLFAAATVYQTILISQSPAPARHKRILLGAFVSGLAMTNQHTIVLYQVPLIAWILWTNRAELSVSRVLQYAGVYLVGLTPYIYMPVIDTVALKPGSWGDTSTVSGFLRHFLRKDYGTLRLYAQDVRAEGDFDRWRLYFVDLLGTQLPAVVSVAFVVGLVVAAKVSFPSTSKPHRKAGARSLANKKVKGSSNGVRGDAQAATDGAPQQLVTRGLVLTLLFYLGVFHTLSNMPLDDPLLYGVHARFWQQPNILACILAAIGVGWLLDQVVGEPQVTPAAAAAGSGTAATAKGKGKAPRGKKPKGTVAKVAQEEAGQESGGTYWIGAAVCLALVAYQVQRSFYVADNSENTYMEKYAKALMDPLPENAIFLCGYDQQWAVGRYLHVCENFRPDLTILNGPVVSYDWFESHRRLYPDVVFPGTHMVGANTQGHMDGGFTLAEFIEANIDKRPVFTAGPPVYKQDMTHEEAFSFRQWGLVKTTARKGNETAHQEWLQHYDEPWAAVDKRIGPLPDAAKYDDSTWESTVRIDYWQTRRVGAEVMLEEALDTDPIDFVSVLRGAAMLEDVLANGTSDDKSVPPAMFKNLGLAYARFVQGKATLPRGIKRPVLPNLHPAASDTEWRERASMRVLELWTKFLETDDASSDPSYENIKGVVMRLRSAASRKADRMKSGPAQAGAKQAKAKAQQKQKRKSSQRKKRL